MTPKELRRHGHKETAAGLPADPPSACARGDTVWRIQLLGAFRAQYGPHVVPVLATQKAGALLAFLAYFGHAAHPRDALVDLLWPDLDPEAGRNNLRTLLHALRRQLAAAGEGADRLLVSDRATARLHPDAFTTDLQDLHAALHAADHACRPPERESTL